MAFVQTFESALGSALRGSTGRSKSPSPVPLNYAATQLPLSDAARVVVAALVHDLGGHVDAAGEKKERAQSALALAMSRRLAEALRGIDHASLERALSDQSAAVPLLVEVSVGASAAGLLPSAAPFELLEAVADHLTVSEFGALMALLHTKLPLMTHPSVFARGRPRLGFLKLCNGVLRRLSKTNDALFRGDLLLMMARVLDVDERSGVNATSEFNVDNSTILESGDASTDLADPLMSETINYRLYQVVWSLQNLLSNPLLLRESSEFERFMRSADSVLGAFEVHGQSSATTSSSSSSLSSSAAASPSAAAAKSSKTGLGVPKFLTNARLLSLQIRDPTFRRQVLLQLSLILQFLLASHPPAGGAEGAGAAAASKAHKQALVLTQQQRDAAAELRARVTKLAVDTPPDGAQWAAQVEHTLAREVAWMQWKANPAGACPPLERSPLEASSLARTLELPRPAGGGGAGKGAGGSASASSARRGVGGATAEADPLAVVGYQAHAQSRSMGTAELRRLWRGADNLLPSLRDAGRQFSPPASEFLDVVREEAADSELDPEMCQKSDGRFIWRTLRCLRENEFGLFELSRGMGLEALERHLVAQSSVQESADLAGNGDVAGPESSEGAEQGTDESASPDNHEVVAERPEEGGEQQPQPQPDADPELEQQQRGHPTPSVDLDADGELANELPESTVARKRSRSDAQDGEIAEGSNGNGNGVAAAVAVAAGDLRDGGGGVHEDEDDGEVVESVGNPRAKRSRMEH